MSSSTKQSQCNNQKLSAEKSAATWTNETDSLNHS